jgi:ATP-binding cassette subfamily B multidrug efflux pump
MEFINSISNAMLIVGTVGFGLFLLSKDIVTVTIVAAAFPLSYRIGDMSHWIMWEISFLFENIGTIDEGKETISKKPSVTDARNAKPLTVEKGLIEFTDVKFNYGMPGGLFEALNLKINSGEKVGLVGRSGSGKSSIVNLLLRLYDLDEGKILIDKNDISKITQDSLRSNIAVVTQDTALLHRSIRENILYGKPDATETDLIEAAKQAEAYDFIIDLEDKDGRKGFDAHVGERGVRLSGGQRQRIAIARVILKNAPILVLDEATSALDSEVETAIQAQLSNILENRTALVIAHRLSTINKLDRLIVMDQGKIIEVGTHSELIKNGGHYANLWSLQSGGFLPTQNNKNKDNGKKII